MLFSQSQRFSIREYDFCQETGSKQKQEKTQHLTTINRIEWDLKKKTVYACVLFEGWHWCRVHRTVERVHHGHGRQNNEQTHRQTGERQHHTRLRRSHHRREALSGNSQRHRSVHVEQLRSIDATWLEFEHFQTWTFKKDIRSWSRPQLAAAAKACELLGTTPKPCKSCSFVWC